MCSTQQTLMIFLTHITNKGYPMFFKTNEPKAIQALTDFFQKKHELHVAADKFAAAFDAKAVITMGLNDVTYAGFIFNKPDQVNTGVWTKPLPARHRISNLRSKPTKKEFKAEWEEASEKLKALRDELFPNGERISKDAIYESLGTDWGNVAFAGLGCFLHDGYVYVKTGLSKLNAQEILGSEYEQASASFKQALSTK